MQRSDRFVSINPINNQVIYEVEAWSRSKIESELKQGVLDGLVWKSLSLAERIHHIDRIKQSIIENREEAALLITREMGKPITQSKAEIDKCIDLCTYYASHAKDILEPTTISDAPFQYNKIYYQPLGGVLGVMPWNFPFWQVFRFAIPAIASGNIVWLKHAPNMNLCNKLLEKIFNQGLNNKIYRAVFVQVKDLELIVSHPHIQGTSLTGSEKAGASFASLSGKYIKKTVLELGGNDAFLICEDANIKAAVSKAVFSRMLNTGQTCISTKRLFIPVSKMEEVKRYLMQEIASYVYNDIYEESTKIGVLARPDLVETINHQIKTLENLGFEHWLSVGEDFDQFIAPKVYYSDEDKGFDQEIFGPILVVYSYSEINTVIKSINASDFGLGAAIWSNDLEQAEYIAEKLEVGSIAINNIVQSNVHLPFGGIKKSGFGRELGEEALLEFVNKKVIYR